MPEESLPELPPGGQGRPPHHPVLLKESLDLLDLKPGYSVVDCTLGAGGHSAEFIARIAPGGRLLGLDLDRQALHLARERLEPLAGAGKVPLALHCANFSELAALLQRDAAPAPNAIFADLGLSSMQLDQAERGFSFRFDAPLDMRMDREQPLSAADILRESSEEEIADILFHFGEEHKARRIAREIVRQREREPILTTGQLERLACRALRVRGWRRVHPATKTFQALRIAVNREMESLRALLEHAPDLLAPGGVLALISFHSLEDRQVKQRFKALRSTGRFQEIGKFVSPSAEEAKDNPRSRSAKLRAIRKAVSGF